MKTSYQKAVEAFMLQWQRDFRRKFGYPADRVTDNRDEFRRRWRRVREATNFTEAP